MVFRVCTFSDILHLRLPKLSFNFLCRVHRTNPQQTGSASESWSFHRTLLIVLSDALTAVRGLYSLMPYSCHRHCPTGDSRRQLRGHIARRGPIHPSTDNMALRDAALNRCLVQQIVSLGNSCRFGSIFNCNSLSPSGCFLLP